MSTQKKKGSIDKIHETAKSHALHDRLFDTSCPAAPSNTGTHEENKTVKHGRFKSCR